MKRHQMLVSGLMVAVVTAGLAVWIAALPKKPAATITKAGASPAGSVTPAAKATPALDPITISAMKARKYTASAIKTDRVLGDNGGYAASVVTFESDGLKQYAYWAQPDGAAPKGGWPVIVLVHGYINPALYSTTGNAYESWIAAWARAGYVVVQPDLRGNGQSQGAAVSGHWDPDYTYDVMNLLASLRANSAVNGAKIGVAGHSMGGHIALNVAVIDPHVAGTVLANGVVANMYDLFYNWPNSPAPRDQPSAAVQGELNGLVQVHGSPKDNPGFWEAASAITYVTDVGGPVEIDADEDDSIVPYAFSQSLNKAMLAAHKSVTLNSYSGNDHQLSNPANLSQFLKSSTDFWRRTLSN